MESSFGERMQSVHATLRERFDKLSRVAIAIYDPHTDQLELLSNLVYGVRRHSCLTPPGPVLRP